jgi:Zinc finger, C2H2 type
MNTDFHSFPEEGLADGQCKRTTLNGKCDCSACTKKSLDKDLRELIDSEIPDALHVFAFHMPPDGIPGQSNATPSSNDLSILRLGPASSQNRNKPLNRDFSRGKSGKRRKIREKSPESNPLALMKEILQSDGTLSPELLTKIQKLVEKEEQSQNTGPTTLPSRGQEKSVASSTYSPGGFASMRYSIRESPSQQQETTFPSSSSKFAIPFTGTSFAKNGLQSCHPSTGLVNSSANPAPFMGMGRSISGHIPSDFDFIATSQSQTASSLSSVPSSRNHDVQTSNTTFVGAHTARLFSSTLYQCTFKGCDKVFPTKSNWKRHEESFHKQRYMCKECCAGLAYPPRGYTCGLCLEGHFAGLEEVKVHTIQCDEAQKVGKSFTRKDNLRTHLRDRHDQLIFSEEDFDWVFDVESDWPRECGFCGCILNDVCIYS